MAAPDRPSTEPLDLWIGALREQVEAALPAMLPPRHENAAPVHDAMAHALLSPGKRIRPVLTLAVGAMYRGPSGRLLPAACALEMVHAASLVFDDLPCMDGAATRRGRPTCHVLFGEATAILAGVGLLNRAFAILAGEGSPGATRDRLRALLARRLAAAIGTDGLIGGQTADLQAVVGTDGAGGAGHPPDLQTLEFIHSHKTGSLFIASAEVGAHLSGATPREVDALASYARNLGLAFQITDDLIDAVGEERAAGKPVRSDAKGTTFVTLCGVEGARALATELTATAVSCLAPFGRRARRLEELARLLEVRDR